MVHVRSQLRHELAQSLKLIAAKTEGMYLSLSATYPDLLRQMSASIGSGQGAVGTEIQGQSSLQKAISETATIVERLGQVLARTHSKDVQINHTLHAHMERIAELSGHISGIQEDSSSMELISLNAMTVALKAGNSGRAFSFITEELKRLSSRTIELTHTVSGQGAVLLEQLREFGQHLEEASRGEDAIVESFRTRVARALGDFGDGVDAISRGISQFRNRASAVMKPLMRIMEEIQKQDLIRQSIDHVVFSLDGLRDVEENAKLEEVLDELVFMKHLPDLCIAVLEDIQGMVRGSLQVFTQELQAAEDEIQRLESERIAFIQQCIHPDSSDSIEGHFINSESILRSLIRDLESVFGMKRIAVGQSRELIRKVRSLEGILTTFSNLVTRFHTIDVASRIEIAKQEVLKQMTGTVDEMTRLTGRMETEVETSLAITNGFMHEATKGLEQYRTGFASQTYQANQELSILDEHLRTISLAKEGMVVSIQSYELFTDGFTHAFQKSKSDLQQLGGLIAEMDTISSRLAEISAQASASLKAQLAEAGLTDWQIQSERFRNIVQKFTMFTHKKIAGAIGGFIVEEGINPGEVTLF